MKLGMPINNDSVKMLKKIDEWINDVTLHIHQEQLTIIFDFI